MITATVASATDAFQGPPMPADMMLDRIFLNVRHNNFLETVKPDTEALMRAYAVHLMAAGRGPKIAARVAAIGAELTADHPGDAELLSEMDPDAACGTLEEEFGPCGGELEPLPEGIVEANAVHEAQAEAAANPLPAAAPGTFLDGLDDVIAFLDSLPLPAPKPGKAKAPSATAVAKAAATAALASGEFPAHLAITSAANPSYQKRADKIREIADAGDLEALKAHPVNGSNTYAIRLRKYRDALVAALTARVAS